MPSPSFRLCLALCTLVLLTACGFHLRGSGGMQVPEEWLQMHLDSNNPNAELSREIYNQFATQGVNWVDRDEANYILRIGPERMSQRNLSLNAQARASEIELTMRTQFAVLAPDGSVVIQPADATIVKQMENDPSNIVGKTEEARLIRSEMRVEIAQQMLRRIAFFASADS